MNHYDFYRPLLSADLVQMIDRRFYVQDAIYNAVEDARALQDGHNNTTGGVGSGHMAVSDPTAMKAIKHCTPLQYVIVRVGRYDVRVEHPEDWLDIMSRLWTRYQFTEVGEVMRRRYGQGENPRKSQIDMDIRRDEYYRLRNVLLNDAALMAAAKGIIKIDGR